MVSNLVARTIRNLWIIRIVVAVILVGMGEGVVGKDLQAVRETSLKLHLKGIVDAAGVVAEIVSLIGGASTSVSHRC